MYNVYVYYTQYEPPPRRLADLETVKVNHAENEANGSIDLGQYTGHTLQCA